MEVDEDIYSKDAIQDSGELNTLCQKLGIEYHQLDLSQLGSNPPFYGFVHTGAKANNYNSGLTNHWMALYGPFIFDSYGKYNAWSIPSNFEFVETVPRALQEYNTNVCGMYSAAYINFCNSQQSNGSDDLGREFCIAYGFGKNREANDTIILSWYDQIMGKETGDS
jgi:hypothetical protein